MDRNIKLDVSYNIKETVALRKESVDRNTPTASRRKTTDVALRKESVDRNISALESYNIIVKSLSARRAWIEIILSR